MSSTLFFVGLPADSKSSITKESENGDLNHRPEPPIRLPQKTESLPRVKSSTSLRACGSVAEFSRVPNAPKSSIGEIFAADKTDGGAHVRNGAVRPRVVRDTPTRPRDTHSRLFGQAANAHVAPMVTDTSRSHIQIGVPEANGGSPLGSPKPLANGHSAASTPSREGNPITGYGYKSMNGQINTVTSIHGNTSILHNRVPPGGYSSGLW